MSAGCLYLEHEAADLATAEDGAEPGSKHAMLTPVRAPGSTAAPTAELGPHLAVRVCRVGLAIHMLAGMPLQLAWVVQVVCRGVEPCHCLLYTPSYQDILMCLPGFRQTVIDQHHFMVLVHPASRGMHRMLLHRGAVRWEHGQHCCTLMKACARKMSLCWTSATMRSSAGLKGAAASPLRASCSSSTCQTWVLLRWEAFSARFSLGPLCTWQAR